MDAGLGSSIESPSLSLPSRPITSYPPFLSFCATPTDNLHDHLGRLQYLWNQEVARPDGKPSLFRAVRQFFFLTTLFDFCCQLCARASTVVTPIFVGKVCWMVFVLPPLKFVKFVLHSRDGSAHPDLSSFLPPQFLDWLIRWQTGVTTDMREVSWRTQMLTSASACASFGFPVSTVAPMFPCTQLLTLPL